MVNVHAKFQTSKVTPEDGINILPEDVITNILDCLPIQDAVRTSILSRKWRYKWTTLTQLVFDKKFVQYLSKGRDFIVGRTISRLLQIKGVIRKFVLYIPYHCYDSRMGVEDINNWVMLLSTKGIREFTLINMREKPLELSTDLLSCTELKHLTLHNFCFRRMPNFCGFPNILTLDFNTVRFKDCKFGELITSCPLLEVLKIKNPNPTGDVKLVDISKLENLKVLSLTLCEFYNLAIPTLDIFQLTVSLRKLQNLALDFENFKFMEETTAGNRVSSALPGLTSLSLCNLNLNSRSVFLFAFDLIQCSPNLQTLKIMTAYEYPCISVPLTSWEVECSMGKLKQLRIVELGFSKESETELCLIRSLLAYCSLLKKMVIYYSGIRNSRITTLQDSRYYLNFSEKLLAFPRASPIAKINLVNRHLSAINLS